MTKLPRTRGRIVIVGIFNAPPPVDLFRCFWRELQICGARVYERQDFERAIELAGGDLPLDDLISDIYPLEKLEEGLKRLEAGGAVMKVLIRCS